MQNLILLLTILVVYVSPISSQNLDYNLLQNDNNDGKELAQMTTFLPIITHNQTWIAVASSGFEAPSSFQFNYSEDSILFDDMYYFKRVVSNQPDGSNPFVFNYFREENGRVYQKSDETSTERLVLDMNLEVGDSITIEQFGIATTVVVSAVDTIQYLDDIMRKRIQLRCAQNPDDLGAWTWVEGIGELATGVYCVLDGSDSYLTCVLDQLGERLYSIIENDENCWLFTNVEDISALELSVSPNPAQQNIQIEGMPSELKLGVIYNASGQLAAQFQTEVIDISDLKSGVYFIKLVDKNNQAYSSKFLKIDY